MEFIFINILLGLTILLNTLLINFINNLIEKMSLNNNCFTFDNFIKTLSEIYCNVNIKDFFKNYNFTKISAMIFLLLIFSIPGINICLMVFVIVELITTIKKILLQLF